MFYTLYFSDEQSAEDSVMLTYLPSELLVPLGESVILECLLYDPHSTSSWHIVNEYGQPIRSMLLSVKSMK